MIEAAVTFLIIIGVVVSTQSYVETFIKEETVDLQAERIAHTSMAMDTLANARMTLGLREYKFKVNDSHFFLQFMNKNASEPITSRVRATTIEGPGSYKPMNNLCINKTGNNLNYSSGGC
jgi:hypothetical protein